MSVSDALRRRVREAAKNRCGYCQMPGEFVYAEMEMDHLHPKAKGGTDEEKNLWLACPRCNGFKGEQINALDPITGETVALFNPRTQQWLEHFKWDESAAQLVGQTPIGRATVIALQLNFPPAVMFRQVLVRLGWYPPKDI